MEKAHVLNNGYDKHLKNKYYKTYSKESRVNTGSPTMFDEQKTVISLVRKITSVKQPFPLFAS